MSKLLKTFMSFSICCFVGVQPSYSEDHPIKSYQELVNKFKHWWDDNYYGHEPIPEEVFNRIMSKGYQMLDLLGSGGSGQVFKAKAPNGNYVVLKFTDDEVGNIQGGYYGENGLKIDYLGDIEIYDSLKKDYKNSVIDFGQNSCKILGYEKIEGCSRFNGTWTCVVLEYIEGVSLREYVKANKFCTTDVLNWLKDICKSLKLMYSKNFLHRSVGVSNVIIRKDGSAVLIDYEKSYYKDRFENLLKGCGKLCQDSNAFSFGLYDYYDLGLLYNSFIDMLIKGCHSVNYNCNNKELDCELTSLCDSNSLENFLKKVDDLCVKYMK